jgi:hypothetical protein
MFAINGFGTPGEPQLVGYKEDFCKGQGHHDLTHNKNLRGFGSIFAGTTEQKVLDLRGIVRVNLPMFLLWQKRVVRRSGETWKTAAQLAAERLRSSYPPGVSDEDIIAAELGIMELAE